MPDYQIIERRVVDRWGEGGRHEVQLVYDQEANAYHIRPCYYQSNGRFGNSPPAIPPEVIDDECEAMQELKEQAIEQRRQDRMEEIEDLLDEVGVEQARDVLQREIEGDD